MAQASNNQGPVDVGRQQIGTVYAKALLGAAEKTDRLETVLAELDSLVSDVLHRLPKVEATFASPQVPHEAKLRIIDQAFGSKMSTELITFLKVLSSHGRLDCLHEIARAARGLRNEMRGCVEAYITMAEPMDGTLRGQITDVLKGLLRRDVDLTATTDPDVIGGLVVRVGDTVYDGSVVNRLNRLRTESLQKSVRGMQDELERFLNDQ